LSKVTDFNLFHLATPLKITPFEFREKTRGIGYISCGVVCVLVCVGQTDRRTDI